MGGSRASQLALPASLQGPANSLWLLVAVSRPLGWFIGPAFLLAGMVYAGLHPLSAPTPILLLALFSFLFPSTLLIFGVNDIHDIVSDRLNPRKRNGLYGVRLSPSRIPFLRRACLISAVFILAVSLLSLNLQTAALTLVLVLLAYFYSAPPVRLKERPVLDSLSNGALFFLIFLCGYSYGQDIFSAPTRFLWACLAISGVHALGAVMDFESDLRSGQRTIATWLGQRQAALFAALLCLLALLFSSFSNPLVPLSISFCMAAALAVAAFPRLAWLAFRLIFAESFLAILAVAWLYLATGQLP